MEQDTHNSEAQRIADEMELTKAHIEDLLAEEKRCRMYLADLQEHYKRLFVEANLEKLSAFRAECRQRKDEVEEQVKSLSETKRCLRTQLKNKEIDRQAFSDRVEELVEKNRQILDRFKTYHDQSIAELSGMTDYDEGIIWEFVFGTRKDRLEGKTPEIEDVYQMRLEILDHPDFYPMPITRFSAGGLGACAYSRNVSIAELVRCWEHEEFTIQCPECGETAYVYQFAGSVNSGGYWEVNAYCPSCNKYLHFTRQDSSPIRGEWTKLKTIADAIERDLDNHEGTPSQ